MIPIQIISHFEEAKSRLISQYRNKPRFISLLQIFCLDIEEFEQMFFDLADQRSIYNAVGAQLDLLGEILDESRSGLTDELYRLILFAKIAQNISKGTPEDVIVIFKILMQAQYVDYDEPDPASFTLIAINANPIGSIEDIKAAVRRAKPAGVSVGLFASSPGEAFGFAEDPDPYVRGFGDLNNPDVGGFFTSII